MVRAACACALLLVAGCAPRAFELGFWFEPVTFSASRIGGALTPDDLATIRMTAAGEVTRAFTGLPVTISDRPDARYRVRVVQDLGGPAGESHAVAGFGGSGAVNFSMLAGNAVAYAPPSAARDAIVSAIGRGVGASAVHEFAHQLLPTAPIDSDADRQSYEFASAGRAEQYYARLHWDLAWPLLLKRTGAR